MQNLVVAWGSMSVYHLILAFCGGIIASAIGSIPLFIIVGIIMFIGVGVMLAGGDTGLIFNVALGYVFGFVGFGGSCAASAYAAKKGYIAPKDLTTALMGLKRPSVLLVGGFFSVITAILLWVFVSLLPYAIKGVNWTDSMALTLFVDAILIRLVFGKTGIFGKVAEGGHRFKSSDTAVWVPWQEAPLELLVIGIGAGVGAAGLALIFGGMTGMFIGFSFSLASLIFLQMGVKIPITHHITYIAAFVAVTSGSLVWGGLFGIVAAFVAQFWAYIFQNHGDTHIDPPMTAIFTLTTVVFALNAAGLFTAIPLP